MFYRDFTDESFINGIFRLNRAFMRRLRGQFLLSLGLFHKSTRGPLSFDTGLRILNSKSICFDGTNAAGLCFRIECHHKNTALKSYSKRQNPLLIKIGTNTSFGDYCHVGAVCSVSIGKNVLIGSNVLIIDHNHGSPRVDLVNKSTVPFRDRPLSAKSIVIEDCVWICDGAKILAGAHICKGSIVSADSIVKGYHPPFSLIS